MNVLTVMTRIAFDNDAAAKKDVQFLFRRAGNIRCDTVDGERMVIFTLPEKQAKRLVQLFPGYANLCKPAVAQKKRHALRKAS